MAPVPVTLQVLAFGILTVSLVSSANSVGQYIDEEEENKWTGTVKIYLEVITTLVRFISHFSVGVNPIQARIK